MGGRKRRKGGLLDSTRKMTMSVPERISESGGKEEESEDESEILEESPCGRWQKRKEQVCPLYLILSLHTHTKQKLSAVTTG